jgi:hypothetical protein
VQRHSRKTIEHAAHDLLARVGATQPEHIDPVTSAKALDIEVVSGGLPGATARVCRHGTRARIRVSDDIVQPGRRWFSIAHEIGHYLLGHAIASGASETSLGHTACSRRPAHEERQADTFAVAHLMPAFMVRAHCKLSPADLYAARRIARAFRASPVASALRLVDLADEPCAAVYSVGGHVEWMKRGKRFPMRIPPRTPLAPDTVAARISRGAAHAEPYRVPLRSWLGGTVADERSTIIEHTEVVPEPGWGGVLSLLRIAA